MTRELSPVKIGIRACLLGHRVRYNGGHQHDRFITGTLGQFMEFVPVCPEVECGLGIPRETLRLVGDPAAPRLVTTRTGIDHTERMQTWARQKVRELSPLGLINHYVRKYGSPYLARQRYLNPHPLELKLRNHA